MEQLDLFPLYVAGGEAFCDREKEREWLKNNFYRNRHSLVMSPRRYGKTSLVFKAIEEEGYAYIHVDLFSCLNLPDVEKKILDGIALGITAMIPKFNEALQTIKKALAHFHVAVSVFQGKIALKIERPEGKETKPSLLHALQGLEKLAAKFGKQKKILFFLDEFQELAAFADAQSVEAIIREVAQRTRSLCFIFSGSNRHLLANIFEDSHKPLYSLCEKLNLGRIDADSYIQHINRAFTLKWGKTCEPAAVAKILELTARHPYYVNVLCGHLWCRNTAPAVEQVQATWDLYVTSEISRVAQELSKLSNNQKKLLIVLAKFGEVKEPLAQGFLGPITLSAGSARLALHVLLNQDLVYQDQDGYKVLDPLFRDVLRR